jgi:hypothetical protein
MMRTIRELLSGVQPRARPRLVVGLGFVSMFLAGCAPMPTGPSIAVMPAPNKPFEVFVQEEQLCRSWAAYSIGQAGNDAAADAMLRSTVTGAAIGTIAGVMVGGERSAGSGAALGTMVGATAGANQSSVTAWNAQRRYDVAYQQCMYSKGNLVPSYDNGPYRYFAPAPIPPAPPPPAPPAPQPPAPSK